MHDKIIMVLHISMNMFLQATLLLLFAGTVASELVTNLPGFEGDLPFKLETGYIGVDEYNEVQLFYYFVESQRSPDLDPLLLLFNGGPGCSSLTDFFYASGPVSFKYENYSGGLPSIRTNPSAWTQTLNIIFLDAPVGTGFSYSTTQESYYTDDLKSAWQTYQFLRKWLMKHPQFLKNQLYIGGGSYAGITVPIIAQNILDGNQAGHTPFLNLKGYVLGNPYTDDFINRNCFVEQAHRLTLISDELYESVKVSCNGDYENINASNVECVTSMNAIKELLVEINLPNILEPYCNDASPRKDILQNKGRRYMEEDVSEYLLQQLNSAHWCRSYQHVLSGIWANNEAVREAIHVRPNTKGVWKRCNTSGLAYNENVPSVVNYHRNLSRTNLRALIYSGDHDMAASHIGTLNWINLLNLTISEYWRAWFVDGQVAGYTKTLQHMDYTLTFATVKGAGHDAPEYKPEECYEMIDRFLAYYPL